MPTVYKFWEPQTLEASGPVQACAGIACLTLTFLFKLVFGGGRGVSLGAFSFQIALLTQLAARPNRAGLWKKEGKKGGKKERGKERKKEERKERKRERKKKEGRKEKIRKERKKERENERKKERKKARKNERRKEGKKEGNKEKRKEGKKERRRERKKGERKERKKEKRECLITKCLTLGIKFRFKMKILYRSFMR